VAPVHDGVLHTDLALISPSLYCLRTTRLPASIFQDAASAPRPLVSGNWEETHLARIQHYRYAASAKGAGMVGEGVLLRAIGVLLCVVGGLLLAVGLAATRWPLGFWKIHSQRRAVVAISVSLVFALGGTFALSRLAFYVLIGVLIGPLVLVGALTVLTMGGFLTQFTMPPFTGVSPAKARRRRAREIAQGNAEYLEILRGRLVAGTWSQMDWEGLWSQCSGKAPRPNRRPPASLLGGRTALPGFLEFILTQCSVGGPGSVTSGRLYGAYRVWCKGKGSAAFTHKEFDVMVLCWTGAERLGRAWTAIAHGRPVQRSWGGIEIANSGRA